MKKILSVLCAVALLLSLIPTAFAAGTVTLSVGDETLSAGSGNQSVEIPVRISGNRGGVCGISVSLSYDKGIKLTGVKQGEALHSLTYTAPGDLSKNPVVLLWDGMEAETGDGIILYLTFSVPVSYGGDYGIRISAPPGSIYDNDLEDYTVTVRDGTIHVEGTPGNASAGNEDPSDGEDVSKGNGSESDVTEAPGTGENSTTGNGDSIPTKPSFTGFYYVVVTMTDTGEADRLRILYYPDGEASAAQGEQEISLGNIKSATVKIFDSVKEGVPENKKALFYVVTEEDGRINVEATEQLNK